MIFSIIITQKISEIFVFLLTDFCSFCDLLTNVMRWALTHNSEPSVCRSLCNVGLYTSLHLSSMTCVHFNMRYTLSLQAPSDMHIYFSISNRRYGTLNLCYFCCLAVCNKRPTFLNHCFYQQTQVLLLFVNANNSCPVSKHSFVVTLLSS